jgi:dTMP kinase
MMYNEHEPTDIQRVSAFPRGRLITFEGIDGSGENDTDRELSARLAESGTRARPSRTRRNRDRRSDPSHLAGQSAHGMCTETELLLFAAARAQLVREVILPDLEAGNG